MPESPLINVAGPEDKLFPVAGQLVGYDSFDEITNGWRKPCGKRSCVSIQDKLQTSPQTECH